MQPHPFKFQHFTILTFGSLKGDLLHLLLSVYPSCPSTLTPIHTTEQKIWDMTYLWSEFPNPLGYGLVHHNFHFASIFLFGDGKPQVISQQEGRAALRHPEATVNADEGGAGAAQLEEQQQGLQPTPRPIAHVVRGQLVSVHRRNPVSRGGLLCFLRLCQLLVQGAAPGVPTVCPKILTCPFRFRLRQGGLSGNPRAFHKTR